MTAKEAIKLKDIKSIDQLYELSDMWKIRYETLLHIVTYSDKSADIKTKALNLYFIMYERVCAILQIIHNIQTLKHLNMQFGIGGVCN